MVESKRQGKERVADDPYHKGNVKSGLITAALAILAQESVEAVTARRLCREVNVSSANFYNHFNSLDDLFQEVAAVGFAKRVAENRRLMKKGIPRNEMLIQIAQNLVEFSVTNSQLFRLMFGQISEAGVNKRYDSGADSSFRVICEIVMGEDIYRDQDLEFSREYCQPAYAYFAFIYGLARCVSQGLFLHPSVSRAERRRFVEDLTRQILQGIAA
jgi:AcrR family transcriptional regulator